MWSCLSVHFGVVGAVVGAWGLGDHKVGYETSVAIGTTWGGLDDVRVSGVESRTNYGAGACLSMVLELLEAVELGRVEEYVEAVVSRCSHGEYLRRFEWD